MIGEGFSWKEFLEKCRVKRKKGSNFIRKSDKHALFVGIITFLIIILLLKYVPCFLPVPCPVPFTTYSIFVIILSLGFSVLWLIYRKPTSKLVIILRIGLPYLIIQGVPPLVAVMFEIGFFMIFFSYLILLPLAIAGLIFGLIYLILYWILKDFFRIDINLKILFAGFLLVLLLFPLWNFYIGRFIIYGLHNDAVDHFKKTYLNTDKIELINQTLGKGGWWTSVDSYYAVDLYEQLYGCKEGLCIYAEYRPEVGAVRVDLFNLPFFMLNKWTLNLRKDDYFTDFELISRDVAEDPPLFIVFNTEDVKPFVDFKDTDNLASKYHFVDVSCDELDKFGITVKCPDVHSEQLYLFYEKETGKTLAFVYTNEDVPAYIPPSLTQQEVYKIYNTLLKRWQEKLKLILSFLTGKGTEYRTAQNLEDINLCYKIEDEYIKVECIGNFPEPVNICEEMKKWGSKCYHNLAIKLKDISLCDKIKEPYADFRYWKEKCIFETATSKEDCDKIGNGSLKERCIGKFLTSAEDCEKINNNYFKQNCYYNLAKKLKDSSLCDKLDVFQQRGECVSELLASLTSVEECAQVGDLKEMCYTNFSKRLNDPNICNRLEEKNWIYNCITEFGVFIEDCEVVPLETEYSRNGCYFTLAEKLNDPNLCNKIEGDTKEICLNELKNVTSNIQ